MKRRIAALASLVIVALFADVASGAGEDRRAVLIFGATGGESYAKTWASWEATLVAALRDRLGFPPDHIVVLTADASAPGAKSTASGVRAAFDRLRSQAGKDDLVVVVLVGHGTADAESARFNLVGPDLDVSEWAALADALPGRLVFVNAAGASFPFLERLSKQGRIVISATDATAQRFDTTFPEQLAKALADPATDGDKNGRVSVWEAFAQASAGVRAYYDQRGQLATERALLDDTGDRVGQEAGASGPDGALARTTYLDPEPESASVNPEIAELVSRQRLLERAAEELKLRKGSMPAAQWEAEFERLMIELARVSRAIRSRS